MWADLVLFDASAVADRATFNQPHQLSVGIAATYVNGVAVWRNGAPTGAKPGRAVRGAGARNPAP
jgi:N-acyl-D-amino-acid deacylase